MSAADLWEAKVKAGMSPDSATAYVTQAQQGFRGDGSSGSWGDTPPARSSMYNALNTAAQGATLGFGDELNAALYGAKDALTGADSFSRSYAKNVAADRQGLHQFQNDHPILAPALQIAGGVGSAVAAAPFLGVSDAMRGASLARRVAAGAGMGMDLGAINGIGASDGGFDNRLVGGAKGAIVGAVGGALAAPAAEAIAAASRKLGVAVAPAARNAMQMFGDDGRVGVSLPVPRIMAANGGVPQGAVSASPQLTAADALLLNRMQRAGTTPEAALAQLAALPPSKPLTVMEMAGDKSDPLVQLGKLVVRTPSTGGADLKANVIQRAAPLPSAQRILGDVSEAMGVDRVNLNDHAATLRAQQIAAAKPYYDRTVNDPDFPPVPLTATTADGSLTLGDLLQRPSMQSAAKLHNTIAAERGQAALALPNAEQSALSGGAADGKAADLYGKLLVQTGNPDEAAKALRMLGYSDAAVTQAANPADSPAPAPSITLKSLQILKFKLDAMLGFAKQYGKLPDGTPIENEQLGAINDTRKALLDIMGTQAPDFATGNAKWAGPAAMQNATDQGQTFLSRPFSDLQSQYPSLTPGEQQQHNIGAVSGPIRDRLFQGQALDRAKILASPDMTERMQVVVPSANQAPLLANIGHEHRIALTNQQLVGGSDTAGNIANAADASGGVMKGVLTNLLTANFKGAGRSLVNNVVESNVGRALQGVTPAVADELAPKLAAGMASQDDLRNLLEELVRKRALVLPSRITPQLGGQIGATLGQIGGQRQP